MSIDNAEAWYFSFIDPDVEILGPGPGVGEFKAVPGV